MDTEEEQINIREENAALIIEIAKLCNRPDRKDPEVIMLLGSIGVGKSAMVNTIIKAMTGKYFHKDNIDVFVVITKCDLVKGYITSEKTSEWNMIKRHQFRGMEKEIAKDLSIGVSMEHTRIRWQSYVDGRCLDDPYIDNIGYKFVRQMMLPRQRKHKVETYRVPVLTPQKMLLLKLTKVVNDMNTDIKLAFWVGILVALVALVIANVSLSQNVKTADSND